MKNHLFKLDSGVVCVEGDRAIAGRGVGLWTQGDGAGLSLSARADKSFFSLTGLQFIFLAAQFLKVMSCATGMILTVPAATRIIYWL